MQKVKLSFKKEERLKSRKKIKSLFDNGKVIHQYPFKVIYQIEENQDIKYPAQIAISVAKKNFKHATDRNHIKRKIRESYRCNKHLLYSELLKNDQNLYFFVIYSAKQDMDFILLQEEMKNLIHKLNEKLNQVLGKKNVRIKNTVKKG